MLSIDIATVFSWKNLASSRFCSLSVQFIFKRASGSSLVVRH